MHTRDYLKLVGVYYGFDDSSIFFLIFSLLKGPSVSDRVQSRSIRSTPWQLIVVLITVMVMDGGSVVAQQPATPTATMSTTPQQQQQQSGQGQTQQQGQGNQTGGGTLEGAPNATRVAREFVRQYYTILHESPVHLHRLVAIGSVIFEFNGKTRAKMFV